jgi:hypothetical protein
MIIAKAQIAMATSHDYREEHQVSEKLDFWLTPKQTTETTTEATPKPRWDEQVSISARGFSLLEMQRSRQTLNLNTQMDARSRVNLMILQRLYETITGRPMNLIEPSELAANGQAPTLTVDGAPSQTPAAPAADSAGFGMVYQRHERYQEQEKMQFKAEGVIQTQDGREIAFSTSLNMSRNYVEESSLIIRAGDAKKIDPLVINFDGKGVGLSQTRFKFDLDSNGSEEQLASLKSGSGFLALDRNGDGIINNGSELFGPNSGRGFDELAQFDEDGNHFIDEGDSIYNRLRIWSFNEDGSSQLVALGDKQIGAIFLGHLTTPFQLKDEQNNSLGEIANTGIYLKENGQTGVVQEINLSV